MGSARVGSHGVKRHIDGLSRGTIAMLLVGVGLLFAPMMLLVVSGIEPRRPWSVTVFWFAVSGAVGAGWAACAMLRPRWIWGMVAVQALAVLAFAAQWPPGLESGVPRPSVEGFVVIGCVAMGYALAVRFIRAQGMAAARLRAELDVAQKMHAVLVPPIDLRCDLAQVHGESGASSEMGGDLVDAVEHGGRLDVLLADVSGHGVGAGVVMAMLKGALRTGLLSAPELGDLTGAVNRVMAALTEPHMFATFAVVRLHPGGTAQFALAGHLPIFHYRVAERRWERHPAQSMPLGVDEHEVFAAGSTSVAPGDLLVMFTDGLIEVQDAAGRELGLEALAGILERCRHDDPGVMSGRVMAAVAAHGPRLDDQSLLVARVGAVSPGGAGSPSP